MKKYLILLPLLALSFSLWAQQTQPNNPSRGKRMGQNRLENKGMIMQSLNLTDAQQAEMKSLNQQFRKQMEQLRENESITVKDQRDTRFNLVTTHRKQMESILTPTQQQQLKEKKAAHKSQLQENQAKRFDEMAKKLNLTQTQKETLQKERQEQMRKMEALQNQEHLDREQVQQTRNELRSTHHTTMKSVLTPEQYENWKEMKTQFRPGRKKGFQNRNRLT